MYASILFITDFDNDFLEKEIAPCVSTFQWMSIYDCDISTPQDMYMYGGLILILNIYFT
jgi:hypothetical protein